MTKITISQEGSNPISITLPNNNIKSEEGGFIDDIKDAIDYKKYSKIFDQTKLKTNLDKIYKNINFKNIFKTMYGIQTSATIYDDFGEILSKNRIFIFRELVKLYKNKIQSTKITIRIWCNSKPNKYNNKFEYDIPKNISDFVTNITCIDDTDNSDFNCCSNILVTINSNIFKN